MPAKRSFPRRAEFLRERVDTGIAPSDGLGERLALSALSRARPGALSFDGVRTSSEDPRPAISLEMEPLEEISLEEISFEISLEVFEVLETLSLEILEEAPDDPAQRCGGW